MKRFLLLLIGLLVFLALPSHATASNTLTQSCNVTGSQVPGTPLTCTLASTLTSGSLLACGLQWGNVISGATFTVSDATNGTYTAVTGTPINDGGPTNSIYLAWAKNTSTAASLAISLGVTGSGTHTIRGGCYEYTTPTGWPSNPVDTQSTGVSSGVVATGGPANVTPAATGELLFSAIQLAVGGETANSFTVNGTGSTRQDAGGTAGAGWGSQTRAEGCDNQNSPNTATACTFNWIGQASHYSAAQVVFKSNAASAAVRHKTVQN